MAKLPYLQHLNWVGILTIRWKAPGFHSWHSRTAERLRAAQYRGSGNQYRFYRRACRHGRRR